MTGLQSQHSAPNIVHLRKERQLAGIFSSGLSVANRMKRDDVVAAAPCFDFVVLVQYKAIT